MHVPSTSILGPYLEDLCSCLEPHGLSNGHTVASQQLRGDATKGTCSSHPPIHTSHALQLV